MREMAAAMRVNGLQVGDRVAGESESSAGVSIPTTEQDFIESLDSYCHKSHPCVGDMSSYC